MFYHNLTVGPTIVVMIIIEPDSELRITGWRMVEDLMNFNLLSN